MLILASASPRRHEILLAAGIDHVVRPSHIDETRYRNEPAEVYVQRIARKKALAISASDGDIVLGADTVVCLEGEVLGKPVAASDAARMLRSLSGRVHSVLTGISLVHGSKTVTDIAETRVWFSHIPEDELLQYISTGEPMDKAGAYGIQGYASRFVQKIDGCYCNVVGLPVSLVYQHLSSL
jgi:septum formation protein